jgi:hypothetical protein
MNFSTLSGANRRTVIIAGVVTLIALLSFLDPSGSWGGVMALSLLGGLGALFIVLQPQMAPTMKMPVARGLGLLLTSGLAAIGYVLAILSYIGYIAKYPTDVFVILMIVGLVASLYLAWTAWQAYQAESGAAKPAA